MYIISNAIKMMMTGTGICGTCKGCDPNKIVTSDRGPITECLLRKGNSVALLSPQPPFLSLMDHPYATRIRQNITLKYTSNFIDHVVPPHNYPPFPPPHVQLHPDDLNNKVFLAIARSFLTIVCFTTFSFIQSYSHTCFRITAL